MQVYITTDIVENHCDYVAQSGEADVHDDFNFLPFHRVYIEGMEDFFRLKGFPQFIPLPVWDGTASTPVEFQVVDADCLSTICNNGVGAQTPAQYCSNSINWGPGLVVPANLTLPVQAGINNDLCDHTFSPTIPGGADATGLSQRLESPYHNSGHGSMGGNMGNFASPSSPIFWCWHAFFDDRWKAWECNCPQSTTKSVDLFMKDNHYVMQNYRDRGEEPNIDAGPMWRSQDIWVRNQPDGGSTDVHQNPEYSASNQVYVYVRVRNRGCQPSLGTETLSLHWAKAATALTWPSHWDGSITVPALMGDALPTQTIPVIQPGNSVIMEFPWSPPNPADFNSINSEPWHFCLLARQISANDPMTFAEGANVGTNTKNNNNIVWKNISVVDNVLNLNLVGGIFNVENLLGNDLPHTIEIQLDRNQAFAQKAIAENMVLRVDEGLWNTIGNSERKLEHLKICNAEKRELLVTGLPARIPALKLAPGQRGQMYLGLQTGDALNFNVPVNINVIQKQGNEIIGGVTYILNPSGKDSVQQKPPKFILNATKYCHHGIFNWYGRDGKLIATKSHFGLPQALIPNADAKQLEHVEFPSANNLAALKYESVKERRCRIFKNRNKSVFSLIKLEELNNTLFKKNDYFRILFPEPLKTESIIMVFNPFSDIVHNYMVREGSSSASIIKHRFVEGENHVYLISQNMIIGFGVIQI
ncbi:MAG: tyrosinase family protein [Saprospiraceae bacterium]